MTVAVFEPPFRFMVDSASRNQRHLVDIEANAGFGQCGCEHHQFKCQPDLDKGHRPALRCRHIAAAREAFADDLIQRLRPKLRP